MSFFYKMIIPLIIISSIVIYSLYQWQLISLNKKLTLKDIKVINHKELNVEHINNQQNKAPHKSPEKNNNNKVTLAFVNLPEPPTTTIKKSIAVQAKKPSPIIKKTIQKVDKKPVYNKVTVTPVENAQKVLKQLTSAKGIKLELAWPTEYNNYQQVLQYFEQCLGMGFGILEGEQLHVLSEVKNNELMSRWLREVNGQLTVNEQRLLIKHNAHKQSYKYVRLFPQILDQSLARLISQTLAIQVESTGSQFSSLFAHFKVITEKGVKKLYLNNIELNHVAIKKSWLLHQSQCG